MRPNSKLFISAFISLAFLFRLMVVSFLPGSTATVFPNTTSFKFKGYYSFKKRRRNNENQAYSIKENSNENESAVYTEDENSARITFIRKGRILIEKLFSFHAFLNRSGVKQIFNSGSPDAVFPLQRKLLSVSILRI